jgi:flagellar basal-body rod modification protein FlgD
MTIAATVTGVQGQTGGQNPSGNAMENLSMDEFLKMMIAELQNQDPMNPMDNTQILQQIGQIREVTSNDRLTSTLDAAFLGQNLATANNLMGQWLVAMSDDNSQVLAAGQVNQVSIEDGIPRLHVGNKTLNLDDISQIQSVEDAGALTEAMALMNKTISGSSEPTLLQPLAQDIVGRVLRVSLATDGRPMLHVKDDSKDNTAEFTVAAENAELFSGSSI